MSTSNETIQKYYDSFNAANMEAFFSLLSEDVVHEINHGKREIGKALFRKFMERMLSHYQEEIVDLVIFTNKTGDRAAAEFFVEGTYHTTDAGLPPACGQKYRLRGGAFFEIKDNLITRVTNYYNLQEWLSLVNA